MSSIVLRQTQDAIVVLALNDPAKRNALGLAMFDELDRELKRIAEEPSICVLLLRGEGPAFCAGFDLAAATEQPELIGTFIERLSQLNRTLRRLPQVVVAAVHGAAIAGGCAILCACDFVFVAPDAKLGYPVHRIGVSPAVTIPTLAQAIGYGAARSLLMGGEFIDGSAAHRIGLATHLARSSESLMDEALQHCHALAAKATTALRVTKAWIAELDGSLDEQRFDRPSRASAALAIGEEARSMLARWQSPRRD